MEIGDFIFKMMGQEDPRQALLAAAAGGGTPDALQPAGSTPAAVGTGAGTAAPAQAQAYTTPPDLMNLYTKLSDRERKNSLIDRGIGLIGASLAQEQNRAGILNAFSGGGRSGSGGGAMDTISSIMDFAAKNQALQAKAAQRAALPAIAKQYGLDLATAQYLFDSGKLDSVIAEAEKPNKQIVQQSDGTHSIVDLSDGSIGDSFGVPKPREVELVDDGNGGKLAVYKDTKDPVGKNNIEGHGNTTDQKDYEAAMLGLPPEKRMPFNDWLLQNKKAGATTINTGPTGIDYGKPEPGYAWKRDGNGNVVTGDGGAPVQIPIIGGSAEKAAKDAETAAAKTAAAKNTVSSIVTENIDEAIKQIEREKNDVVGSTGWGGLLTGVPGSDAKRMSGIMDTIKANIGFDKLNEIRAASKTGAALGPVSDFENKLLQATLGSLDQTQEAPDVLRNLKRIRRIYSGIVEGEFVKDQNGTPDQDAINKALGEADAESLEDTSIDDLVKMYTK